MRVPPPGRKKTTKAERDRIQKRSADRKRQRAVKAKGEAVGSEEALRRRTLQERVPIYRKGKSPVNVPLGRVLHDLFALRDERIRLLHVLVARLRQLSPT